MPRDPRFDVLFEQVQIGPVTARNRFFQVPHCNGMGYRDPKALAAMRGMKAEGGWAVVSTEEVEIHPSSEVSPYIEGRIWDDADLPAHELVVDAIHANGSLAAIELVHTGMAAANQYTRVPPMGPSDLPLAGWTSPIQARAMTKSDIADFRAWHRAAVERSIRAGYDIVYVYAGHGITTLQHFLSPRFNLRDDEYGGSLENRSRLLREVLEDTREVAGGRAAVACRIAVDEMRGALGYTRADISEVVGVLAELPDLWDFTLGNWEHDSVTSRFGPEAGQEDYVVGLKQLTSKPVVGVGRFTSPETMLRMVTRGTLDFIGAARPSIADPFLPRKIEEGRADEIRECIGCNICVSGDFTMTPIRCTQNPSMGEEWRRGWHPERSAPAERPGRVLIVGAGPAGLEATVTAGRRGFQVVLVEATRRAGGRASQEAEMPGLAAWRRVVDYRLDQIGRLPNVELYLESPMDAEEALAYGFEHIGAATGARWRRDGVGHHHTRPIPIDIGMELLSPDDLLAGRSPDGSHVIVFDDDHYYLGSVLAEHLVRIGRRVTLVTPEADVAHWTHHTMEQHRIQARLLELGVEIVANHALVEVGDAAALLECTFTGVRRPVDCDAVVPVTGRLPDNALVGDLQARRDRWLASGLVTARAVGDALSPGTIASAVWDGRRFGEDLGAADEAALFRRSIADLS